MREDFEMNNRKKCKTCKYRADRGEWKCNYILIEGHSRGCSVENCTKYKKGKRLPVRENIPWSMERRPWA